MGKGLRVACAVVAMAVGGLLVVDGLGLGKKDPTMPTDDIRSQIESALTQTAGQLVTVTCPSPVPAQTGYIFDCTANAGPAGYLVRVTENDSRGHVTWLPTAQPAP